MFFSLIRFVIMTLFSGGPNITYENLYKLKMILLVVYCSLVKILSISNIKYIVKKVQIIRYRSIHKRLHTLKCASIGLSEAYNFFYHLMHHRTQKIGWLLVYENGSSEMICLIILLYYFTSLEYVKRW